MKPIFAEGVAFQTQRQRWEHQPGKKRILIVDDDETITTTLAAILTENEEYEVEISNDPHEAYERASIRAFDLVICDLVMPPLDGDMLFLCLGVDPDDCMKKHPQPKFLLISGSYDQQKLHRAFSVLGSASYLQKPFGAEILLKRVASIFAGDS